MIFNMNLNLKILEMLNKLLQIEIEKQHTFEYINCKQNILKIKLY